MKTKKKSTPNIVRPKVVETNLGTAEVYRKKDGSYTVMVHEVHRDLNQTGLEALLKSINALKKEK